MAKTEKEFLVKLLADAAQSFDDALDKALAERLSASIQATEYHEWNRKLIVTVLAKSGSAIHAETFSLEAPAQWERAESLFHAAKALWDIGEKQQALAFLAAASQQADEGQDAPVGTDQLDASSVLGEIAVAYAQFGAPDEARKLVAKITDLTRKARASEALLELAPPPPEEKPSKPTKERRHPAGTDAAVGVVDTKNTEKKSVSKTGTQSTKKKAARKAGTKTAKKKAASKASAKSIKKKAAPKAGTKSTKKKAAPKAGTKGTKKKAAPKAGTKSTKKKAAPKAGTRSTKKKTGTKSGARSARKKSSRK
jgi:hypothetical protein